MMSDSSLKQLLRYFLILAVAAPADTQTVSFSARRDFPIGSGVYAGPYAVAVVDLNGDGKPDLAVANWLSNDVSVRLGNGDGTFQVVRNFSVGIQPGSIAVTDFNGDGKPDLAVANYYSGTVSVLLGNGDGSFQAAVNVGAGSGPISVGVSDLNGDGKPDLTVANNGSNNISVLLGNGDGSFQAAVNFAAGSGPMSVSSAISTAMERWIWQRAILARTTSQYC